MSVRNILIIARRELRSYFNAPVAYIVLVTFLLVVGFMFFGPFFLIGRADMRPFFAPSPFSPSMLLLIIVPALTMRLVAEERRSGTIELLTTMPLRDGEVILGKFLAAVALMAVGIGLTLTYPLTISTIGPLDWGPVIAGYLGLIVFVKVLVAIGLLSSTLTKNQIVAFIIGFIICAALYFVYWLQFLLPQGIAELVEFMSVSYHLENWAKGVVDSRSVIYYASLIVGGLFLAERSLARQHA